MSKLISLAILIILSKSILIAQNTNLKVDSLEEENTRLKSLMNSYRIELDLKNSNSIASIDSANLYYYDLKDFKKSKIYYYQCPQDPKRSHYWKVTSNPKNKTLITEAYDYSFVLVDKFEEKYDSLGSKLIDYKMFESDSTINTVIEKDLVYLWESLNEYSYQVKYNSTYGIIQFSKTRKYQRMDSLLVLGNMNEVLVFRDEYKFYNTSNNELFNYTQFSYYSKKIGFVKYERSTPINETDLEFENLELEAILSKREWKKLIKGKTAKH